MPSLDTVSIYIVNEAVGCSDLTVESQVSFSACFETFIVRISNQSNAAGPFSIYTGSTSGTPVYSAVTRVNMVAGQSILLFNQDQIGCETPTPTPTPTNTPTPSITPSITPTTTITPTPSVTPTITPTSTLTPTPTPTPTTTPVGGTAYLFIEPQSGSTDIGQYMFDNSYSFFGFTNLSAPDTSSQAAFSNDMNGYISYSGWTGGTFPSVRTQIIPQVSGGVDSFGNSISAFNFTTHEIPVNTVNVSAWYTWIIPTGDTNGGVQLVIDYNSLGNPNILTPVVMDNTIFSNTVNYTGTTIPPDVYRVYTTFANLSFYLDNGINSIYFKGNTVV